MKKLFASIILLLPTLILAQVNINIDFTQEGHTYSRYIFGKNNSLSNKSSKPLSVAEWNRIKDAGITMLRENAGNNSTKYNWRRKLTSHPDWYNNVFECNWDFMVQSAQENLTDWNPQVVFGFQLLGKAAKSNAYNFNSWDYNRSNWWSGVHQNLAGGGEVNSSGGSEASKEGNTDLYLEDWPADSTVGILDHWFGADGLGIDKNKCLYWCMDNEPGIWNGTHDDVASDEETMEDYLQKYFTVAKKARAKFPGIKLIGPIICNEWQWFNWHNNAIQHEGKNYNAIEYFIKRISEEQQQSGVRLLDVFAIHFYPTSTKVEDVVQYHRVFFDENYEYPEANGIHRLNGDWDASINKEYIFKRVRNWLEQYMGNNHGVELGMTETGVNITDPDGVALWYASTMGEFMKNDVDLFIPWHWSEPMWEVLHLFSNYSLPTYFDCLSSNEELVSCHTTVDKNSNKATCFILNRSVNSTQNIKINAQGTNINTQSVKGFQLNNLSNNQTFFSKDNNALSSKTIAVNQNQLNVTAPPLSIIAVTFNHELISGIEETKPSPFKVYPNLLTKDRNICITTGNTTLEKIELFDVQGNQTLLLNKEQLSLKSTNTYTINLTKIKSGIYFLKCKTRHSEYIRKVIVIHGY